MPARQRNTKPTKFRKGKISKPKKVAIKNLISKSKPKLLKTLSAVKPITPDGYFFGSDKTYNTNASYNTNFPILGQVLIINMENFRDAQIPQRHGTSFDAIRLSKTFKHLGFEVTRYDNLTTNEVTAAIKKFANSPKSKKSSIGITCILSHGEEDIIHTYDGTIRIQELSEPISQSKCWKHKPKVFIFQACRGGYYDKGQSAALCERTHSNNRGQKKPFLNLPQSADLLFAFATSHNYVSWRDQEKGSIFIQQLCDQIEKNPKREFTNTLQATRNAIVFDGDGDHLQGPGFCSQLTEKLFFKK